MPDQLNAGYWNKRYSESTATWDLGSISPPLKNYIDQLPRKNIRILIPGCGNSYEAAYLLEKGFTDITVIDVAEMPVKKLQQEFAGNKAIKILHQDFFTLKGSFDLILEQTFFCAIGPSLRKSYVKKMHTLLSEKGKLSGVLFNREFEKEGPPFGGSQKEYKKLFSPFFHLRIFETCYNSILPRKDSELFICLDKK